MSPPRLNANASTERILTQQLQGSDSGKAWRIMGGNKMKQGISHGYWCGRVTSLLCLFACIRCGSAAAASRSCPVLASPTSSAPINLTPRTSPLMSDATPSGWQRFGWMSSKATSTWPGTFPWRWVSPNSKYIKYVCAGPVYKTIKIQPVCVSGFVRLVTWSCKRGVIWFVRRRR